MEIRRKIPKKAFNIEIILNSNEAIKIYEFLKEQKFVQTDEPEVWDFWWGLKKELNE